MKGSRAVRALAKREKRWQPEEDDENFELEGHFFSTGVEDGSPNEGESKDLRPTRNKVQGVFVSNVLCLCAWKNRFVVRPNILISI